jgi:hypothetical protein
MMRWFLSLLLLIYCITFNNLHMLNHPSISGMKLTSSWFMIFLIHCLICLPIFYWEFLQSMFIKEIGL